MTTSVVLLAILLTVVDAPPTIAVAGATGVQRRHAKRERVVAATEAMGRNDPRFSPAAFSPDGKYVVLIVTERRALNTEMGTYPVWGVYRRHAAPSGDAVYRIGDLGDDYNRFLWLPGHAHTLLFAASEGNLHPSLRVWSGGTQDRLLLRKGDGTLILAGYVPRSHEILFQYFSPTAPSVTGIHRLRLTGVQ